MRRVFDGRLARLAAERTRFDSTTGLVRCTLRAWNTVYGLVRDGLVQAGVDPESATAVQLGGMAAHMTDSGDTLERRRLEEELAVGDHDGLAGIFTAKIRGIAQCSGTDTSPISPLPPWPSYLPGVWHGVALAVYELLGQAAFAS